MHLLVLAAAGAALAGAMSAAGPQATVLAPGVISTSAHEGPFALTPDGRTIYFTRFAGGMTKPKFFVSHLSDDKWSEPRQAAMPEGVIIAPLCFSADGRHLFYTHERDASGRARLWVAERDGEGWKNTRPLGGVFEKWEGDQVSPAVTADGTLYFTSARKGGIGASDVYRSRLRYGQYQQPELLGRDVYGKISTMHNETSVAVAAAGGLMVFSTTGAFNGLGGSDLLLADMRDPVPQWDVQAWNLGPAVNTSGDEMDPNLSPDGKRLYFCRDGDIYEIDLEGLRRHTQSSVGWVRRADMPVPRIFPQVVSAQGRVYVYGGTGIDPKTGRRDRWVDTVEVYDPVRDSWSVLGPGPSGWKRATLAAKGDRVYLFRQDAPGVAEYRAESKDWLIQAETQPFVAGAAVVVIGEKAYTMRAEGDPRELTSFSAYDFGTHEWARRASMPFAAFQFTVFRGRIYAFCAGGQEANRVAVYDPAQDRWAESVRMPAPRWETGVVTYGNEIWLVGGHSMRSISGADFVYTDVSSTVLRFDPERAVWSPGPDLPSQRVTARAVVVNGRLFVMGGIEMGGMLTGGAYLLTPSVLEYLPEGNRGSREAAPEP